MYFKPIADNVLVKVAESKVQETASGLIIPGSEKKKPNHGVAVAIGSGTLVKDGTKFPIEIEAGQTVIFKEDAGVPITIDDEEYLVMREYEILGVVLDEVTK